MYIKYKYPSYMNYTIAHDFRAFTSEFALRTNSPLFDMGMSNIQHLSDNWLIYISH